MWKKKEKKTMEERCWNLQLYINNTLQCFSRFFKIVQMVLNPVKHHIYWSVTTKSNTPSWVFFTFLKLYKWYQIARSITYLGYFFLFHSVISPYMQGLNETKEKPNDRLKRILFQIKTFFKKSFLFTLITLIIKQQ